MKVLVDVAVASFDVMAVVAFSVNFDISVRLMFNCDISVKLLFNFDISVKLLFCTDFIVMRSCYVLFN